MYYQYKKTRFKPKRPVRSFRDLEVYQKSLEAAVFVSKKILPILEENNYLKKNEMVESSLDIPRILAEAHSARFDDNPSGTDLLQKSMTECNKMVVYLEQVRDIYSDSVERVAVEEVIKKYIYNRVKIFRLYKAWERIKRKEN